MILFGIMLSPSVGTFLLWCASRVATFKIAMPGKYLSKIMQSFWCVNVYVTFGAWGCVSVQFTLAVCRQFVLFHGVFWCLPTVHSVVKKVAQYMADVLEDSRDKVQENLLANGGTVGFTTECLPLPVVHHFSSIKGLFPLHLFACFLARGL